MIASQHEVPQSVPILSKGKHRNPRKGACFMELASYLAGERWSDHPRCTHPLLAELARLVNDCTSDERRSRLAPMIPSVIGLTGDDLRTDARIALLSARMALPVASADRQNVLAVSVLTAEHVLGGLDGRPAGHLEPESQRALEQAPLAADWARTLVVEAGIRVNGFRRHSAPNSVRCAVRGIAEACVAEPDDLLHQLLSDVIEDCASVRERDDARVGLDEARWDSACRLTVPTRAGR
ncbi:MAG: hypothetical protein ACRDV1_02675 [Actinomycetes bacterium]